MNYMIKGTHSYSPSETTKDYLEKKISKFEFLKESIEDLHLNIDKSSRGVYKVSFNIHFHWGKMVYIKTSDRNLFKAIDSLFDKAVTKSKKEKSKIRDHG